MIKIPELLSFDLYCRQSFWCLASGGNFLFDDCVINYYSNSHILIISQQFYSDLILLFFFLEPLSSLIIMLDQTKLIFVIFAPFTLSLQSINSFEILLSALLTHRGKERQFSFPFYVCLSVKSVHTSITRLETSPARISTCNRELKMKALLGRGRKCTHVCHQVIMHTREEVP